MQLPTLAQIEEAQAIVYRHTPPTPQFTWPLINQRLGVRREPSAQRGRHVGMILTGANVDASMFASILNGDLVQC